MNMEKFRDFVAERQWIFAKTYAKTAPHEYTVKDREGDKDFEYIVSYIRKNGYEKQFWRKTYTYFDLDGYSYWTMGVPVDETIIINRVAI